MEVEKKNISVSVIIPTFNSEQFILNALECVNNQTVKPDEIIIVDDGSNDGTVKIVEDYMVRNGDKVKIILEKQENAGAGAARNRALALANGDWISFLDSDDTWHEDKISKVLAVIRNKPDVDIIAHEGIITDIESGKRRVTRYFNVFDPNKALFPQLYWSNFLVTSSLTIKKELLDSSGNFDTSLKNGQDYDLWLRLAKKGHLVYLDEPLTFYTDNRAGSVTNNVKRRYKCEMIICKRYIGELFKYVGVAEVKKRVIKRIFRIHISEVRLALRNRKLFDALYIAIRLPIELLNIWDVKEYESSWENNKIPSE